MADLDETARENVVLVVTELLSNAIRHARALDGGTVVVTWDLEPSTVRVSVMDGGSVGSPQKRTASDLHTGGRGLAIVDYVAQEWGVTAHDGAVTSVWAVVSTIPAVGP